jgi:hypothetical protein
MLGGTIQYRQPWAFSIAIARFAPQVPRMGYEEDVLACASPSIALA